MPNFDLHNIANLVGQVGGNHQQAAQMLQGLGGQQIDPSDPQHADLLQQIGIDPQQLQSGGYQQQLSDQNQPGFQGYQPGADLGQQAPQFNDQGGGQQDPYQSQGQGYNGQGGGQYGQGQQDF